MRLGQCLASLRVLGGAENKVKLQPNTYLNDCYQTWLSEQLSEDSIPDIVREAAPFIHDLGLEYRLRAPLAAGLFVADTVTGDARQKFALEPRPMHLENAQDHLLGEARWRFKMLDGTISHSTSFPHCCFSLGTDGAVP